MKAKDLRELTQYGVLPYLHLEERGTGGWWFVMWSAGRTAWHDVLYHLPCQGAAQLLINSAAAAVGLLLNVHKTPTLAKSYKLGRELPSPTLYCIFLKIMSSRKHEMERSPFTIYVVRNIEGSLQSCELIYIVRRIYQALSSSLHPPNYTPLYRKYMVTKHFSKPNFRRQKPTLGKMYKTNSDAHLHF